MLSKQVAKHARKFFPAYVIVRTLKGKSVLLTLKFIVRLLISKRIRLSLSHRIALLIQMYRIDQNVPSAHSFDEYLACCVFILENDTLEGSILEAGAYKGAGTAKLSIVARACRKKLFVFDSFAGLPNHSDPVAITTLGYTRRFAKGDYCGTFNEVLSNVTKYGAIESCVFVRGYFEETIRDFNEPLMAVFSDVDLVSSYKSCFQLFPCLVEGGKWFTQDAHIPAVYNLFVDDRFWENDIGIKKPQLTLLSRRLGYFSSIPAIRS